MKELYEAQEKCVIDALNKAISEKCKECAEKDKQIFLLQQQIIELEERSKQPMEYSQLLLHEKYQIALTMICEKFKGCRSYETIKKKFDERITRNAEKELR